MRARRQGTSVGALGAVTLAAFLLGTAGTAAALGPDDLGAEAAAAWRTVLGGLGLVVAAAVVEQGLWRYRVMSAWTIIGACGVAANQLTFFEGIERTGVAVGTLVTVATVPVTAGVLDWLAGRRPPAGWAVGVVIATTGVGLLTGSNGSLAWTGVGFSTASGAAGAGVGLAGQQLMRDRPMLPAMATVVGGGAVLLSPIAVREAGAALGSPSAATTVAFLGLFTMAGAYALLGTGLQHLSLGVVGAVTLLEPAVAATLAATVLREPVTVSLVVGVAVVLVGVTVASRRPAPPASAVDPAPG